MNIEDHLPAFLSYLSIEKAAMPTTLYDYRREIERLIPFLENEDIRDPKYVSVAVLRSYLSHARDTRRLSPTSASKVTAVLKSFFNYLEEVEAIIKNPARKLSIPRKKARIPSVISKPEFERIISTIDLSPMNRARYRTRNKLIFSILFYTGVRRNELLNLSWDDIDLGKSTLRVRNGKGGKDRIVPVHSRLKEQLEAYLNQRLPLSDRALIIGTQGKRLCKASFVDTLNFYLTASGLAGKGYSAHSFRHSFATRLIETGADLFKVQRLMGHASLDSTKVYVSFKSTHMAAAVERL